MTYPDFQAAVEQYSEDMPGPVVFPGFEEACVGIAPIGMENPHPRAIYDTDKVIQILMDRDGMAEEEATEYFEYNIAGQFIAPMPPLFIERIG